MEGISIRTTIHVEPQYDNHVTFKLWGKGGFVHGYKAGDPLRVQTSRSLGQQKGPNIKKERSIEWQIYQLYPVMQTMVTISCMAHLTRDGQSSVSSRLSLGDSSRKLYHVGLVRVLC